ncbi:hypothetical protein NQ011_06620 [Corynebacterium phoceense]|uniref:hypothetical protein n=1 Tax=Corynebacterium phoceense TaxID=1686286 RepID=UPI001DE2B8B5|nr:hypothetical protein [Corynebacterium phoceense]MCQ9336358.1 hypothetical protein [Corynebacterium phoceense]HJG43890.1 hypothetical protein [Corynebacterium phoceense]
MDLFSSSYSRRSTLAMALTLGACVVLIVLLKVPGLMISFLLVGAALLMMSARPESTEHDALRTSIQLSSEDIRDVMAQFEDFEVSQDTDIIADRTLHRPALLDLDTNDPDIEAFHYQCASASRFLKRLPARLASPMLDTNQLEQILSVTDQRAASLQESWLAARQAAFRLGPDYKQQLSDAPSDEDEDWRDSA